MYITIYFDLTFIFHNIFFLILGHQFWSGMFRRYGVDEVDEGGLKNGGRNINKLR